MNVSEYLVEMLIKYGVTDVFGVPGGVILKFIYALESRKEIKAHLNYNEQMAGFAACGYAQTSGRLGVAYATRGPGITNMYTCIAEAYQESLPVLFLTSHAEKNNDSMRFEHNQELDLSESVKNITKFSASIDDLDCIEDVVQIACTNALSGRKGPVFLDICSKLWSQDFCPKAKLDENKSTNSSLDNTSIINLIKDKLEKSRRPIFLIGDGIRQANCVGRVRILDALNIPILSSRGSQDICAQYDNYYGYIGSHGTRYSNFILAKSDFVISLGNRMGFPTNSKSFGSVFNNKVLVRFDIDAREFHREIPNAINIECELNAVFDVLDEIRYQTYYSEWNLVCRRLYEELKYSDITQPVARLSEALNGLDKEMVFVSDVGNNEFWFSRAFELVRPLGSILCSKSYGTLGNAIGRAIGAYFATHKNILCVIGDQGFQYNFQELQFIKQWNLPIKVIVLNNSCSSMIRDHEEKQFGKHLVHVDEQTGYDVPCIQKLVEAYDIKYVDAKETFEHVKDETVVYEIRVDKEVRLTPNILKGDALQNMFPKLDEDKFNELDIL